MAIPDFETFMLPTLNYAADKQEHSVRETIDYLARKFTITEDERKELLPSGGNSILNNRISWTLFYLRKAGSKEELTQLINALIDNQIQQFNLVLYDFEI